MSTKPHISDAAPQNRSAPGSPRSVTLAKKARPNKAAAPGILDAVCDQHGDRWVRYGARERAI